MLVTNFNKRQKDAYIKALREYRKDNKTTLYIDNNAFTSYGKDENMCALRLKRYEDLTEFWRIFDKNEQRN